MKKILLLILLALSLLCFSQSDAGTIIGNWYTAAGCGSFSTGGAAHEDWDGTDDLTWTDDTNGAGVIDDNESTIASGNCGFGTNWLQVTMGAGSYGRAMTYTDLGGTNSEIFIRFVIYFNSEGLSDGQGYAIFSAQTTTTDADRTYARIDFKDNAGQLQLQIWSGQTARDTCNISIQTVYCVEANWDNTNGDWEWKVTAQSGGTFPAPSSEGSGSDDPTIDFQRFKFGQDSNPDPNRPIDYVVDNFDISTSGWLGCDDA